MGVSWLELEPIARSYATKAANHAQTALNGLVAQRKARREADEKARHEQSQFMAEQGRMIAARLRRHKELEQKKANEVQMLQQRIKAGEELHGMGIEPTLGAVQQQIATAGGWGQKIVTDAKMKFEWETQYRAKPKVIANLVKGGFIPEKGDMSDEEYADILLGHDAEIQIGVANYWFDEAIKDENWKWATELREEILAMTDEYDRANKPWYEQVPTTQARWGGKTLDFLKKTGAFWSLELFAKGVSAAQKGLGAAQKPIEWVFLPFTISGQGLMYNLSTEFREAVSKNSANIMHDPEVERLLSQPDGLEKARAYLKKSAITFGNTDEGQSLAEWWDKEVNDLKSRFPSGEVYEAYQKEPFWKKLLAEAPAFVAAAGIIPSATHLRAGLKAPAAQAGAKGFAARGASTALAPVAGVEWAVGQAITLPVKGLSLAANKTLNVVLSKNAKHLAILARRPALTPKEQILKRLLDYHNRWLGMKVDAIIKASGKSAKAGFTVSSEATATSQTVDNVIKALQSGKEVTPESLAALVAKNTPGDFVRGLSEVVGAKGAIITPTKLTPMAKQPVVKTKAEIEALFAQGKQFDKETGLWGEVAKETVTPKVTTVPETTAEVPWETGTEGFETTAMADWTTNVGEAMETLGIKAEVSEPIIEPKATVSAEQVKGIHAIAAQKQYISEKGKMKPQYRRLAKLMTGKSSTKDMTPEEADFFMEALHRLPDPVGGKPPKIPLGTSIITEKFAEKIPTLQEIGLIERFRPARKVFEKMGLYHEVYEPAMEAEVLINEAREAFGKELKETEKLVGKSVERRQAVFDAIENPSMVAKLSDNEQKAVTWFRKYFDDWADKLKLAPEKRRTNYVTHIFEEDISQQLKAKHPLDMNLIKAFDFISPKTVFNPFLQQRLGLTMGLKRDPFAAAAAYNARALKKFFYEPLLQRIRVYEKYLPPNATRALREYETRISGRPLAIDRETNQSLRELAGHIGKLPKGSALEDLLTKGNASALAAYRFTGLLYTAWLGARPASAIKNISQHGLILAEVGPLRMAKGIALKTTKEGQEALKQSMILRGRKMGYLPGVDETFADHFTGEMHKTALWMFRKADKINVSDAFLSGYSEARAKGLPADWAIKRGDEVAAKTQYVYSKLAGSIWNQSSIGRVLGTLTTWPTNWLEKFAEWGMGKPSMVYSDYAAATGKVVEGAKKPIFNKQFMTYMALVGLLYTVEKKTRIRASMYSGWTSLQMLGKLSSGNFPGLEWIGGIGYLLTGSLTGDTTMIKSGWNKINPARTIAVVNQLLDIASGERDWLSFFVYENQDYVKKKWKEAGTGRYVEDIRSRFK